MVVGGGGGGRGGGELTKMDFTTHTAMYDVALPLFHTAERPDVTAQPTSQQNVVPGTTITFTIVANGSDLTYQWQRNGETLTDGDKYSGTTTATLTVMNVMEEDEGNFTCVVANALVSVTSSAAQLTVRK